MRTLLLSLVAMLVLAPSVRADEGMWTYNNFPKAAVKQKYKVDVHEQWLEHVRLSSVRFNNGGSGSFVSPTGLVMTNHHIGADCIHALAKSDKDLIKNGFYAKTRDEEIKCPDLELDVLVDIADVTRDVGGFIYDEAQNRAVSVHSSALIEALRHGYDAGPLADELQVGKKHTLRTANRRRP